MANPVVQLWPLAPIHRERAESNQRDIFSLAPRIQAFGNG